jgi:hypothetical protein
VSTTLTQFKVRVTPKSHGNMPAPDGSTYSVTATITSFTSSNGQAGTDTDSATVTIDNDSPDNVSGAGATPGDTHVTVSWTNPGDADFSNLVVLCNTATISDVPSEGSSPAIDSTIGSSTVRYISSGTSFVDNGLTNGQIYFYRIFAKDNNGNYSATGVEVSATPAPTMAYQTGDGKGSVSEVDDSLLDAANPTINYGTDTSINVDGSPVQHAVIKFPNIFGPGANQIPRGSVITSATLEVYIPSDTGSDATVYQLTEAWNESQVTWDNRLTGQPWTDPGANGTGSHKTTAEGTLPTGSTGWQSVDVTTSVQNWSNCETNEGWVFIPAGTGGWTFASSESGTQANRPKLTVTYGAVATITTIGDGTDPGPVTIAPGAGATVVDAFTLQIDCGEDDTVTQATVTLAAGTSGGISLVEITSDDGSTVYGSASNPASDTVSISGMSIPVSTTLTQFKVRITPKSHANMPAPAGSTYSVTATITSFTSSYTQAGTDTDSATVTIDNLSPGNVTGTSATPGDTQVTVSWTNPGDADFSNFVVLRNTATITDVPSEGSSPAIDSTIGTSVVRYIFNGTSFVDNGLTNGQIYFYRIFTKDTNGNYSGNG